MNHLRHLYNYPTEFSPVRYPLKYSPSFMARLVLAARNIALVLACALIVAFIAFAGTGM